MRSNAVRFSLATLMSIVAGAALIFAALKSASAFWASAAFTLALAILLFALLAALFRRDAARAFWLGFLLFGWTYLCLAFAPWFSENVKRHLVTSNVLGYTYNTIVSLPSRAAGRGMVLGDIDNDGWADLYLAGQQQANQVFRNVGNGQFVDITNQAGVGTAVADYDLDGQLDVYVSNYALATGPTWENFERVGHSLFALLAALVGGLFAFLLWRSRGHGTADGSPAPAL